ncbi:hypothetical protein [Spirulina sp. 06S082]|uniref:hypothetical protein n=1 Tax=Spirulina sp. 06S082 TaxID=3110248 RepID=UPI002B2010E9|nr:hypothetical protein [Spirulina sp. 06S082]MEA5469058.1 hypothetical protein [Spirulina sp. 06S082]
MALSWLLWQDMPFFAIVTVMDSDRITWEKRSSLFLSAIKSAIALFNKQKKSDRETFVYENRFSWKRSDFYR